MSIDKQIEELAISFHKAIKELLSLQTCRVLAKDFIGLGYRKASEVAREIFEEIDAIREKTTRGNIMRLTFFKQIDELKKKYTEGEE